MYCSSELMTIPGERRRRKLLSTLTLSVALPLLVALAIPACLLIGAIGLVWNAADEILKRLDKTGRGL